MGIKNDKWIRRQCTPPKYRVTGMVPVPSPRGPSGTVFDVFMREKAVRFAWDEDELVTVQRDMDDAAIEFLDSKLLAELNWQPMIAPFEPRLVRERVVRPVADQGYTEKIISYGTSSYGYDIRPGTHWKVFTNINSTVVDPKNFDDRSFVEVHGDECIIPPNSFALAATVERFKMPSNVLAICLGKSTYARCGIIVNVTPLEPDWEGHLTLEFSNTTPLPAKMYANEGCAQLLFFEGDQCETTYSSRSGKYQNQDARPILPRL